MDEEERGEKKPANIERSNSFQEEYNTSIKDKEDVNTIQLESDSQLSLRESIVNSRIMAKFDLFPYEHEEENGNLRKQKTWIGSLGTAFALVFVVILSFSAIRRFFRNSYYITKEEIVRKPDVLAEIPFVALLFKSEGEYTFNAPRYIHASFRLRSIFNGDIDNDASPRVYMDINATDCYVYYDLSQGDDNIDESTGTFISEGCLDVNDMNMKYSTYFNDRVCLFDTGSIDGNGTPIKEVGECNLSEIPATPSLQGTYGEPNYWFLEVALNRCTDEYATERGITCANETEWELFWENDLDVSLVFINHVSRATKMWGNLYRPAVSDKHRTYETYFEVTQSYESRRDMPTIKSQPSAIYLRQTFDTLREKDMNSGRKNYMVFYIRLGDILEKEIYMYSNMFDCLNSIGGVISFVFAIFGLFFININRIVALKFSLSSFCASINPFKDT